MLLPTSLVGSYPQPEWLIDRAKLSKQVPRVRADDLWLVASGQTEAAQDDATILAIRDQERAGLDIITDGEQRRESYSNRFATALDGIDIENSGHGDQPQRPAHSGATHGRADPANPTRSSCAISRCCAPIPTAPSRRRCPVRSRWAGRRRTTTTRTKKRWRWPTPTR